VSSPIDSNGERTGAGLQLIEDFVNTLHIDGELREESLGSPKELARWIRTRAQVDLTGDLGPAEHERTIALREALRALLLSHNGAKIDPGQLDPLRRVAAEAQLQLRLDEADREVRLAPAGSGLVAFEAKLLLAIAEAQALGTWERLKACVADDCHWAFYDATRNRSRTWCSMEVCGNREKTRRYRRRRKG
jgi:predicted RNA-binding Zn ribbon-like protein